MSPHATKPFYSSQVHPTYLPTLHKSGRIEKKLALGIVAAAGIGYGLQKYKETQQQPLRMTSSSSSSLPAAASQAQSGSSPSLSQQQEREQQRTMSAEEFRRRRDHVALMDAYGDRSSLDSLEAAVRAYGGSSSSRGE